MKGKLIVFICVLVCLIPLRVQAYDDTQYQEQLHLVGGDHLTAAVPKQSAQYLDGLTPSPHMDIGQSLVILFERSSEEQGAALRSALRSLTKVMLVVVLTACASGFRASAGGVTVPTIELAGALGVTAVLLSDLQGMLALCTQTLEQISTFSGAMMPVMAAAVSLSGAPVTATVLQAATMFAFDILIRFITIVLIPAVGAYIAIITVNTALGNDMLGQLAHFVKWITTSSLKLLLTLFIAYITISGSLGGSVDGVTLKAAKFAVSGSVPVVGGIISDAAETMLSGAALLKNTVGVFGMLCIVAICIVPFFCVGANYLLFKAGSAVLSPVCSSGLTKLISGISDSFGILLGMLGTCSAIIFFELVFTVSLVKPT